MVGHLTGVGAGQKVALIGRVHDEAPALCGPTEGPDLGVGENVAERGAHFEQTTVLVFIARVADPLVKSGLDAVELKRNHFRTRTEGLAHRGGLHHAHHGVERGFSGRHEDVRNPFFSER